MTDVFDNSVFDKKYNRALPRCVTVLYSQLTVWSDTWCRAHNS